LLESKLDYQKQADEILKIGNNVLTAFIKGHGQELAPFQRQMFLIGFAMGIIFDRFTEEEANKLMDIIIGSI
jgi:hypothetical protein